MAELDWDAAAEVQSRDDDGSDLHYNFRTLKRGRFAEMIRWALDLPADERARVVVEGRGVGSHNIHDIAALAARPDFPTA